MRRTHGVDVETDPAFQNAEWRIQWGLGGLVLLTTASVLGYVGSPTTLFRVVAIYGFLLVVFRLAGKRTLAQMTSFDLLLVLVIGDATQQTLIGDDFTLGTAFVAISSLVLLDVSLGFVKSRWPAVRPRRRRTSAHSRRSRYAAPRPHGTRRDRPRRHPCRRARTARSEEPDEIDFAVLERSGGWSIIAKPHADDTASDR